MRKAHKQEVLEFINSLHQAHMEVKEALQRHNYDAVQNMLSECQEFAVTLGENIEKSEGEGHVTVSHVEEYCETLFRAFQDITDGQANENRIYKMLRRQLLAVENSVKNDIPVKKEIAFFPYKASMWDSLESVYLAAKEDPECDAYCVPIPYFDLNPDHSFGEMHYEGNEYPANIEITDWQCYNFEERKPDVIYIHNPYDNWNLVTSVPERYFSGNLKKYTDCLVYIPYFVLDEIESDNQEAIEHVKHFCFLPGIIWADKVIVQSENMRQIYISEFIKAAGESGLPEVYTDRKNLENKILGLGSPKFDKVRTVRREDLEVPIEWRKVIEKPDGTWKKIIFYNTSVVTLLRNGEKMIEKIKRIFEIFREQREEVALLWRPHPLIPSTIKAMRPELGEEYRKLVENYRAEGFGIYDDSAELDRAVVLSDAYYGDMSSVVQVYQETGKPVMIQNVEVV